MKVIKRNGDIETFYRDKIVNAITLAMDETEKGVDFPLALKIAIDLEEHYEVESKLIGEYPTVEEIQDDIEYELSENGRFDVAKRYILYREERNKARNKVWEMNELQRDIYEKKYRYNGENFDEFIERVSGGNKEVGKLIRNQDFMFAGRILAGRGVDRNVSLSNCYVLPQPNDNLESIFDRAKQMARTYSYSGGVGMDLSKLRPNGYPVNNSALTTTGAVSFMELYSTTTGLIGQRGRRGALMLSMNVDHPDIIEFINSKRDLEKVNNANISVKFTDKFFEDIDNPKNQEILNEIARSNWESGEPGALYWDRVENWHPLSFHPEYKMTSTNPCVVGDSLVQTVEGNIPIKDLVGKKPYVYSRNNDGKLTIQQASKVWLSKRDAKLVKVITGKGEIICTPDHRIMTNKGWVEAQNLVKSDRVIGLNRKTQGHRHSAVALSGNKKYEREHRFIMKHFDDIKGMDVHHINDDGFDNRLSNLEIISHSEHSVISNTGKQIEVERDELGRFIEKDIKTTRVNKSLGKQVGNNWYVKEVIHLDYVEDVYDMTVPNTHNFIANDIVVHNCGEQPLPDFGSCLLGSVNLSNFVVNPYTENAHIDIDRLREVIKTAVVGMNEVLDEGIPLHPLKEQQEVARDFRQIGLGVMGLADMFIKLGVEYGSPKSMQLSNDLGRTIKESAYKQSIELAKKYGTYPKFDVEVVSKSDYFKLLPISLQMEICKYGMRNSHVLSIAPTGSISTMLGISGGIEPIFAKSYTRTTKSLSDKDVDYKVYHSTIEELMNVKGITNEKDLPEYVITSHEINPINRIRLQGVWQHYIDSAISSTINLNESATVEDIKEIYIKAHEHGLKGVTVFRNNCFRLGILNIEDEVVEIEEDCVT